MAGENITRQDRVLAYVKQHEPISQPALTKHFAEAFGYKNKESARVGVSLILGKLKAKGLVVATTRPNEVRGNIDMNIWRSV